MLHYPNIDPVAIHIYNNIGIRWYSIAYVVSFIIARRIIDLYLRKCNNIITEQLLDTLMTYSICGLIIGARVFYCLCYDYHYYIKHLIEVLYMWEGGLSFHGGAIGVTIATMLFARKYGISFFNLLDVIVSIIPIGIFFVRIGNFINAELYGRATTSFFGMIFPTDPLHIARHPSQLYEAFMEGVIIFIIMQYLFWKQKLYLKNGLLAGIFGCIYSGMRFIAEFFREPDWQLGFIVSTISMGQLLSIAMFLISILWICYHSKRPDTQCKTK